MDSPYILIVLDKYIVAHDTADQLGIEGYKKVSMVQTPEDAIFKPERKLDKFKSTERITNFKSLINNPA